MMNDAPHRKHTQEDGAEEAGQALLDSMWELTDETGLTMEELAIGWLKTRSTVGGVLVGTRNGEQSRELEKLLHVDLDESVLQALCDASDQLKNELGGDIDMWGKGRTR